MVVSPPQDANHFHAFRVNFTKQRINAWFALNGGHNGATDWVKDFARFPRSASTEYHVKRLKIENDTTGDPWSLSERQNNLKMRNIGMQMYGLLGNAHPPLLTLPWGRPTACSHVRPFCLHEFTCMAHLLPHMEMLFEQVLLQQMGYSSHRGIENGCL